MKKALFALILAVITLQIQAQNASTETIVIKTKIYCDHCRQCESCSMRLNKELTYIKGIKSFKLNDKAMTITVKYNPGKITVDQIREQISKIGFDADNVKADETAYNNLDDCCKKSTK